LAQQVIKNENEIPDQLLLVFGLVILIFVDGGVDFNLAEMRVVLAIVTHDQRLEDLT